MKNKDKRSLFLSVIIPCFNEESTIAEVVANIRACKLNRPLEIIIVDDASTDATRHVVTSTLLNQINAFISLSENRGKGYAIREGLKKATGEFVIIQDADLEYSPTDYPKLCSPVIQHKADVVFGSRFAGGEYHRVLYFWHYIGNKFLTLLSNLFTNLNLTDMETGYKLIRTDILNALDLREDRFGIEPELAAKLAQVPGIRIYEVGINYFGRTYDEGKKIGWRDGFRAVYVIIKHGVYRRGA